MVRNRLTIADISAKEFREFAMPRATSLEIGPIQTSLDGGVDNPADYDRFLFGLWGCATLCAVACLHIYQSPRDQAPPALKLDSVIVDNHLRRRGLAGLIVAQAFVELVADTGRNITNIYAHSVHPGTVNLLRWLGFGDPQVTGAPISAVDVDDEGRTAFLERCETQIINKKSQFKLQCEFCQKGDKRARPWCLPRGEKPKSRPVQGGMR